MSAIWLLCGFVSGYSRSDVCAETGMVCSAVWFFVRVFTCWAVLMDQNCVYASWRK